MGRRKAATRRTLERSKRDMLAAYAAHGEPRPAWWPPDLFAELARLEREMMSALHGRYATMEELNAARLKRLRCVLPSLSSDVSELFPFKKR